MTSAFEEIRSIINNCPKLFHLRNDLPLFLHTDASDVGIGAYLFQREDNDNGSSTEYPLKYFSKALQGAQKRWSTAEKEAFAIYTACKKFEPILQDRVFTLRTDHSNLTYISTAGSSKVLRWKLALQEFQFFVEHIAGVHNTVADILSRNPAAEEVSNVLVTTTNATIPQVYRNLIGKVHNSVMGHHGVSLTIAKVKRLLEQMQKNKECPEGLDQSILEKHKWPKMRTHVDMFIKSCPGCQKQDQHIPRIVTTPFSTNAWQPMDIISIDSIGPFPESKEGYQYVITIIDDFTRFVELFATKSTTAIEAAQVLVQHFGRYGIPNQIRSDNGSQYVNETINNLMEILEVERDLITPHSHEENGIVERANKEIIRHLSAILYDKDHQTSDWPIYLPLVQRIINATKHEAIGMSPAQLLFCNNVQLDRGLFIPAESNDQHQNMNEWISKMVQRQQEVIEMAKRVQSKVISERQSKQLSSESTKFAVNSLVLLRDPNRKDKLQTRWIGPFRVVNVNNDTYTIQHLINQRTRKVHLSRLKQFQEGAEDPLLTAAKDKHQDIVETILQTFPPKKGRAINNYRFRVKWRGEEDDITIEPYANLKRNIVFHNYLRENHLENLIPREYQ